MRILRLVRAVLRAVRLLKLSEMITELADATGINLRLISIFRLLAVLLYLTHILGCVFRLLAGYESDQGREIWLSDVGRLHADDMEMFSADQARRCPAIALPAIDVAPPRHGCERAFMLVSRRALVASRLRVGSTSIA